MRDRIGYLVVAIILGPVLATTSMPYGWLVWPGAGVYLSGAILAFASGVLRRRRHKDLADAAFHTSVLLMRLGELAGWLLLAVAAVRLLLH